MRTLVLVLYVFISHVNAQNDSATQESFDELKSLYAKFIYKDASKALTYAIKGKDLALVKGNDEQLVQFFYCISKCQNRLDKNTIALKNIEAAIAQGATVKDTLFLPKCFTLKGIILSELGEDSKALIAYLKVKEYAAKIENYAYEIHFLISIASIKKKHKDFQEAIDVYKGVLKNLNTLESPGDRLYYRLLSYMHIADAYLWMEKPDDAEIYNNAGLQQCSEKDNAWAYYILLMNKAIISYQRERYKEAIELTTRVRDSSKVNNENLYLTSLFYLGKSSYQLKAYKEAIFYLENAYTKINASADVDMNEKELHTFLALAYFKVKNLEKAEFHFQKYKALEKKQSIEDLKINNETHKLIDIPRLKTEIASLGNELSRQNKNKKGFIILSIILLLLFFSSIFYYKLREKSRKKKFKKLLKKVTELENVQEKKVVSRKDKIPDKNVSEILDKIESFEKEAQYLSTECNLNFMAEKLETNATYLSKVINRYKGKSYTAYITELRINTALVRLKNEKKLQSYTIKAIAEEFGFKRQETFSRAFKAQTGIYPSQYLKNLSKNSISIDKS